MLEPEYSTHHVFPLAAQVASIVLSAVVVVLLLNEAARYVA